MVLLCFSIKATRKRNNRFRLRLERLWDSPNTARNPSQWIATTMYRVTSVFAVRAARLWVQPDRGRSDACFRKCSRDNRRRPTKHVGSKEAGPLVAAIISIVETCRRLSLPLRAYLGSVLRGLAIFRSIESLNSPPRLGRPGSNRRNPAAPSNLCVSDVYNTKGVPAFMD
jgi:hypothetical protein